jgi:hypothetical protein
MLLAARRARTLVVIQGLTRQAVRCLYFSLYLDREVSYGHGSGVSVCLDLGWSALEHRAGG